MLPKHTISTLRGLKRGDPIDRAAVVLLVPQPFRGPMHGPDDAAGGPTKDGGLARRRRTCARWPSGMNDSPADGMTFSS